MFTGLCDKIRPYIYLSSKLISIWKVLSVSLRIFKSNHPSLIVASVPQGKSSVVDGNDSTACPCRSTTVRGVCKKAKITYCLIDTNLHHKSRQSFRQQGLIRPYISRGGLPTVQAAKKRKCFIWLNNHLIDCFSGKFKIVYLIDLVFHIKAAVLIQHKR